LDYARSFVRVGIIARIFRRDFHVLGTIKAKCLISERDVVEGAMMRLVRFRMDMLTEMLAGDAHARNRNFSLQLKRADQLYERGQKSDLLLHR
jgi:hypothetical protein